MKKIGVYGSLRKGKGNHRLIQHSNQLSQETVAIPFRMVSLGGFPGLIPTKENQNIIIEVYEVDDSTYRDVERLEGFPRFYQKAVIETSQGEAEIYVLEDAYYQKYPSVETGDWNNPI
jgi:gamma-glutamylcyclotransferase (GGCT)/AIG2-like uncharacterized protein YtfP